MLLQIEYSTLELGKKLDMQLINISYYLNHLFTTIDNYKVLIVANLFLYFQFRHTATTNNSAQQQAGRGKHSPASCSSIPIHSKVSSLRPPKKSQFPLNPFLLLLSTRFGDDLLFVWPLMIGRKGRSFVICPPFFVMLCFCFRHWNLFYSFQSPIPAFSCLTLRHSTQHMIE